MRERSLLTSHFALSDSDLARWFLIVETREIEVRKATCDMFMTRSKEAARMQIFLLIKRNFCSLAGFDVREAARR